MPVRFEKGCDLSSALECIINKLISMRYLENSHLISQMNDGAQKHLKNC